MAFTDNEKIAFFDKIAAEYFNKNFGSMSKTDYETLLFSEYIEHRIKAGLPFDDYTVSKELGITQSRVRSLKERKELKYPYSDFDWKESFAREVKNAKYDENDHYVKIIIQDINVMNEIRHFIEDHGWYDECSLNRKLLRIPLECFVDICVEEDSISSLFSNDVKKKVKSLAKSDSDAQKFIEDFTKEGLKTFLMNAGKEILLAVLSCLPFGGAAEVAFRAIEKVIKGL